MAKQGAQRARGAGATRTRTHAERDRETERARERERETERLRVYLDAAVAEERAAHHVVACLHDGLTHIEPVINVYRVRVPEPR